MTLSKPPQLFHDLLEPWMSAMSVCELDPQLTADILGQQHRRSALHPVERDAIDGSVDRRVGEFADGRWCAHQALMHIGVDGPIVRGDRNQPLWPTGVVGSITHSHGYVAAAVASDQEISSVGIDVERYGNVDAATLSVVASTCEQEHISTLVADGIDCAPMVFFSAKESLYKAWFPLMGQWLGFDDVDLRIHRDGTFRATVIGDFRRLPAQLAGTIDGVWATKDNFVATAVVLPTKSTDAQRKRFLRAFRIR